MSLHLITDGHVAAVFSVSSALADILHATEQQEPYVLSQQGLFQILKRHGLKPEGLRAFYEQHLTSAAATARAGTREPADSRVDAQPALVPTPTHSTNPSLTAATCTCTYCKWKRGEPNEYDGTS